ncbi:MAG: hypothetical protein H6Q33_3991 [Deltaproteobacteria bacterium]|nr:hypothetical protein [Deltaproteobacteria bacterium]
MLVGIAPKHTRLLDGTIQIDICLGCFSQMAEAYDTVEVRLEAHRMEATHV